MEKENTLIFKEKPYYSKDEQRLYYKIAIDESLKQGNIEMAAHYQLLLDCLDSENKSEDEMLTTFQNKHKK